MSNKGLPVSGYTDQTDDKVATVNANKILEERAIRAAEAIRDNPAYDGHMVALAITNIQAGFMWLNRAVFRPTRIDLPEDGPPLPAPRGDIGHTEA